MMMIKANGEAKFMALYEALASEVRWRIMSLIADNEMNVKEIAAKLELSPSIVTMHIRKLEQAGLTGSHRVRLNGGTHKMCFLKQKELKSNSPLPLKPRGSESRPFQSVIIPRLMSILHVVLGHKRKKLGFGTIPAIFSIPNGSTPAFCGLGEVT